MKNSIEAIWKEGFLNETSLVAPKINDLYNQKSKYLVDKMEKMFRVNLIVIVATAIFIPFIYYFLDALWEGTCASVLLLLTAWYNKRQISKIKTLDQGKNSLEYVKSLHRWLKDVLLKSEKIARVSYPLYILIAVITIASAWNKQGLTLKIHQKFPDFPLVEHIPLFALITGGLLVVLMYCFSVKVFRWEVRLMYGRVIDKLEETIAEMEELKQS